MDGREKSAIEISGKDLILFEKVRIWWSTLVRLRCGHYLRSCFAGYEKEVLRMELEVIFWETLKLAADVVDSYDCLLGQATIILDFLTNYVSVNLKWGHLVSRLV